MGKQKRKPKQWANAGPLVTCPHCSSRHTKTYCSRDVPIRYHKCLDCKRNFKTTEKVIVGIADEVTV